MFQCGFKVTGPLPNDSARHQIRRAPVEGRPLLSDPDVAIEQYSTKPPSSNPAMAAAPTPPENSRDICRDDLFMLTGRFSGCAKDEDRRISSLPNPTLQVLAPPFLV